MDRNSFTRALIDTTRSDRRKLQKAIELRWRTRRCALWKRRIEKSALDPSFCERQRETEKKSMESQTERKTHHNHRNHAGRTHARPRKKKRPLKKEVDHTHDHETTRHALSNKNQTVHTQKKNYTGTHATTAIHQQRSAQSPYCSSSPPAGVPGMRAFFEGGGRRLPHRLQFLRSRSVLHGT